MEVDKVMWIFMNICDFFKINHHARRKPRTTINTHKQTKHTVQSDKK